MRREDAEGMLAPHGSEQPPTIQERAGFARARSPRSVVPNT
jgi:hypothetical protein